MNQKSLVKGTIKSFLLQKMKLLSHELHFSTKVILVIAGLTLIAKVLFIFADFQPRDDALYYHLWFKYPLNIYPDHPPFVGFLVGLSTLIFGHHAPATMLLGFFLHSLMALLAFVLSGSIFVVKKSQANFENKKNVFNARVIFAISIFTVPYFAGASTIMSPWYDKNYLCCLITNCLSSLFYLWSKKCFPMDNGRQFIGIGAYVKVDRVFYRCLYFLLCICF